MMTKAAAVLRAPGDPAVALSSEAKKYQLSPAGLTRDSCC